MPRTRTAKLPESQAPATACGLSRTVPQLIELPVHPVQHVPRKAKDGRWAIPRQALDEMQRFRRPLVLVARMGFDELRQVCPQGRLVSDIVSSRLTQHGFPVTEVRLSQQLHINKEGETILSRELGALAKAAKADTVVTATWSTVAPPRAIKHANTYGGTYDARKQFGQTYVTLKAVRISDGLVLGSQTFAPPTSWSCE